MVGVEARGGGRREYGSGSRVEYNNCTAGKPRLGAGNSATRQGIVEQPLGRFLQAWFNCEHQVATHAWMQLA